jgi:Ni/Co efflux regulator RcnB
MTTAACRERRICLQLPRPLEATVMLGAEHWRAGASAPSGERRSGLVRAAYRRRNAQMHGTREEAVTCRASLGRCWSA